MACVAPGRVSHPLLIIKEAGRPPPIRPHYYSTPPPGWSLSAALIRSSANQPSLPLTSGARPVAPQRLIIDVCPSAPQGSGLFSSYKDALYIHTHTHTGTITDTHPCACRLSMHRISTFIPTQWSPDPSTRGALTLPAPCMSACLNPPRRHRH